MQVENFESKVKHLTQSQLLTGAISSLNKFFVDKGVLSEEEIQN